MANELNKTSLLKTQINELRKTKYFYDATGRPSYIVEAKRDALNGDPCLVTKFSYTLVTDTAMAGSIEYQGTWNSSWDIAESTPS